MSFINKIKIDNCCQLYFRSEIFMREMKVPKRHKTIDINCKNGELKFKKHTKIANNN